MMFGKAQMKLDSFRVYCAGTGVKSVLTAVQKSLPSSLMSVVA